MLRRDNEEERSFQVFELRYAALSIVGLRLYGLSTLAGLSEWIAEGDSG